MINRKQGDPPWRRGARHETWDTTWEPCGWQGEATEREVVGTGAWRTWQVWNPRLGREVAGGEAATLDAARAAAEDAHAERCHRCHGAKRGAP